MKSILKLCVGAVLLLGASMGVSRAASGLFPDAAADQSAYQSVDTLRLGGISFDGEFSRAPVVDRRQLGNDDAFETTLGWASGSFNIKLGYQEIEPNSAALRSWTDSTGVQGPIASASYAFSSKLRLDAEGNLYRARNGQFPTIAAGLPSASPLGASVGRYQIGLNYGLSNSLNLNLGYESVQYDLSNSDGVNQAGLLNAGKPTQTYITLGVGHKFDKNASMKVMYQILNYNDDNTGLGATTSGPNGPVSSGDAHAAIALTQFDFKF